MNQRCATGAQFRGDQFGDRAFGEPAADGLIKKCDAGGESGWRRWSRVRESVRQQLPKIDQLITRFHEGDTGICSIYVQVNISDSLPLLLLLVCSWKIKRKTKRKRKSSRLP